MSIEILCTLGPSSMNDRTIARLEEMDVALFRVNLSHTKLSDLEGILDYLKKRTAVPVCLDTEGAQIRTGELVTKQILAREHSVIHAHRQPVPGDAMNLNFYPIDIVDRLEVGDFISIDFNAVLVQIISKNRDHVAMRVLNGGPISQNKAVTVERKIALPVLTGKDESAIRIGMEKGIRHVALSFANAASDVDLVRSLCAKGTFLISKIECRNGLLNLDGIAAKSDALLIDRGDLSRQEPLERIPLLQKMIINRAKKFSRKVYVATNLLESMIVDSKPTRAEVNDVYNTLTDGADGLVLAAETAIGADPIRCVQMVVKLIRQFESPKTTFEQGYQEIEARNLLAEPHGGKLVQREALAGKALDLKGAKRLPVPYSVLMDCEQIATGTYSPITGFMDSDVLDSVLADNRLPSGVAWTMPILCQLPAEKADKIGRESLVLTDRAGTEYALLSISQVYRRDLPVLAEKWFGTNSKTHPGVAALHERGDRFVAGEVTLLKRLPSLNAHYQLAPSQSRFIFAHKGWSKVVGFHTRNVAHRIHEHIQKLALDQTNADGLYISPLIGPIKKGDFLPDPILKSYQTMIDFGLYPASRVVLGCFATYPRFCGPREAVFTALCRKNMGCSHFIVGRNHSGVGDFYQDAEYRRLFAALGDIGIQPVFFEEIGYNPAKQTYDTLEGDAVLHAISGTQMRQALKENKPLPPWFMREVVQDMLRADLSANRAVFYE